MTASTPRSMLPPLTATEAQHSAALQALLRAELAVSEGWLSFERFMELALYAPGLGYYSAGSVKLGAGGDFVTAPESSDLFSRCLARQCAAVLTRGDQILELGAGSGRMAAALLRELAALDALPERYAILEVSADLAARQRQLLAQLPEHLSARVVWLEQLPAQPISGVILANEVADALPCHRFRIGTSAVEELGVALAAAGAAVPFRELARPAAAPLRAAVEELDGTLPQSLPAGYVSELCLRVTPWVGTLAGCLARGLLLLCDYGLSRRHYYHPQRQQGTLRCHFKQRAHDDPYINVGVQDITAWVDFTRVAEAGVDAGLELAGFATQAAFLLALGIEELVAQAGDGHARVRLAGEARRLLLPGEMGEAFKMLALTRALPAPLQGFALQDLRAQL
jgi:SAM-dependent MidA family methyltransferase